MDETAPDATDAVLRRLGRRYPPFPLARSDAASIALDALPLDRWLDAIGRSIGADVGTVLNAGIAPRAAAAALLARLAFPLAFVTAALHLSSSHGLPGEIRHFALTLSAENTFDLGIDTLVDQSALDHTMRIDAARHAILSVYTPVIAALAAQTGLAMAAQWRIVADMIAASGLAVGRLDGDINQGMAFARALLFDRPSRLSRSKTGFVGVDIADPVGTVIAHDWFLVRGGCCRRYTMVGPAGYCPVCPLLPEQDRHRRLTDLVKAGHDTRIATP